MGAVILVAFAAALIPAASPAQAAVDQIFTIDCPVAHYSHDDPIVFPNRPGASHAHAFFANTTTDASSTTSSLLAAPSTCENGFSTADHSAYWVPTLMRKTASGLQEIHGSAGDTSLRVYYRRSGDQKVTPFPRGLRMVAGDHMATSPQPNDAFHYRCRDLNTLAFIGGDTAEIPSCTQSQFLMAFLHFPNCWDGRNLDSADHKSHMADDNNGTCPASHPVKLPAVNYEISYFNVNGPSSTLSLSSGGQYSLHGDFMAAWDTPVLQALINKCINGGAAPCFGVNRADLDVAGAASDAGAAGDAGAAPAAGAPGTGTAHHPSGRPAHRTSAPASPKPTKRPAPLADLKPATGEHVHSAPGNSPGLVLTSGQATQPHTARAAALGGIIILIGAIAYAYLRIRRPSRPSPEHTEQP